MINVCSMFKNSQNWAGLYINQVDRYFFQMGYQTIGKDNLQLILSEGGSTDDTRNAIESYQEKFNIRLLKDDGLAVQSSVDSAARFSKLASITDSLFNTSKEYDSEYTLLVESDIIIGSDLIENLIAEFNNRPRAGIIAPVVLLEGNNIFYDTCGFIDINGRNFTHHQVLPPNSLINVMSVGSCALIKSSLIHDGLNLGGQGWQTMNKQIIDRGFECLISTGNFVLHPGKHYINGRWV